MANNFLTTSRITTDPSVKSIFNTINPLSQVGLFGETKDYVPAWLIKAFSSGGSRSSQYEREAGPAKIAHILAKITAGGVALGGAAWLLRGLMHSMDIDNVENIKAGTRASRKLQTTKLRPTAPAINYKAPKEKKPEEELQKEASYGLAVGALPPMFALAALMASFKLADKTFDQSLGTKLDKELAQARSESQDLALNRILRNRVPQEAAEPEMVADAYDVQFNEKAKQKKKKNVQKVAALNKEAWLPNKMTSSLGLFLAALLVTGGVVGFNWQRANSPVMAKYKAAKKGLETYNKERALSQNIESTPLDPELLAYLDSNLPAAKKNAPAAPAETSLKELMV